MVVNLADQDPKPSETHTNTFPQDSDSDSESEIELRSIHTSPETTTSKESDGTLVDTSSSTTPTPSLSVEGDLDSAKSHSKPIGGTLPLTDKGPPDSVSTEGVPQEKHLPPGPSETEGPTSTDNPPPRNTADSPPDLGDNFEKRMQNLMRAREETVTTPPSEESEQIVTAPPSDNADAEGVVAADPSTPKEPSPHREDSPTNYPPKDHPESPLGTEEGLVVTPTNKTPHISLNDPISRFWSGQSADTSDTNKRRRRWLIRKPERRHSVELEELDKQDPRPYRYVLRRA